MEHPDLDSYLDEILIGGRDQSRISLSAYDPNWPARFESEKQRIEEALGRVARVARVEHIGSTARAPLRDWPSEPTAVRPVASR